MDSLRWTRHLNDCLRELAEHPECRGDEVLVQLVRIQLISERASLSTWYDTAIDSAEQLVEPPFRYIKVLLEQLEQVRASMPAHLAQEREPTTIESCI